MIRRLCILLSVLIGTLGASAVFPYFPEEYFVSEGFICEYFITGGVKSISIIGIKPDKLSEMKEGHALSFPETLENEGETYPVVLLGHQALHQYDLSGITELVLHDSFKHVLPYAINNAPSIEKIVIGESLEDIVQYNLEGMTGLKEIHFKQRGGLRFIGCQTMLKDATNFSDIYVYDAEPFEFYYGKSYDEAALYPPKYTLHVPAGSRKAYASAPFWEDFDTIVEDSGAGVDEATADTAGWGCTCVAGGIEISGLADGAVRVFTPDGRLIRQTPTDGRPTTIQLPAGIYVVNAAGRSLKVAVR